MRKSIFIFSTFTLLAACNESGTINEKKLDAAGEKVQKTVQKGADSVGAKLKKLVDKLDKDSTH